MVFCLHCCRSLFFRIFLAAKKKKHLISIPNQHIFYRKTEGKRIGNRARGVLLGRGEGAHGRRKMERKTQRPILNAPHFTALCRTDGLIRGPFKYVAQKSWSTTPVISRYTRERYHPESFFVDLDYSSLHSLQSIIRCLLMHDLDAVQLLAMKAELPLRLPNTFFSCANNMCCYRNGMLFFLCMHKLARTSCRIPRNAHQRTLSRATSACPPPACVHTVDR